MKNSLFFIFIFAGVFNSNAQSDRSFKEKLQKTHQSFFDGILAEDYAKVNQLLAEDVSLGFPDGKFSPKQDYINALKNGTLFYDSSHHVFSQIRTFGNTGIINGNSDLVFRYKDQNGQWFKMLEHLSYTAVYVMDKNRISMVAWQSNRPTSDSTVKVTQ